MTDYTAPAAPIALTDGKVMAEAVRLLDAGGIAAIPTETVYGLAADAADSEAVASIYRAKGRPDFNPLIVHVADREMAGRYAAFTLMADRLAATFWPGPLTLVLPRLEDAPVSPLVTAGLSTIALRVPAHPVMQAIVRRLGRGVAAPSANASGRLSPTRAEHVRESLGDQLFILDGGPCTAGLESSIVAVDGDRLTLVRHGAVPLDSLREAAGTEIEIAAEGDAITAPGMMLRHYAPQLPLRLGAKTAERHEFHLGFGSVAGNLNLSPRADLAEAAAALFHALHAAQSSGRTGIAVAPIPAEGLGVAINDRLRRAARG